MKDLPQSAFAHGNADPLGIYVHVPFCGSACDYCAFYREEPRRASVEAWIAGIARELEWVPFPRAVDTFFIGGGTPGVLSAENFSRLAKMLVAANGGNAPAEWSVELAPATVKPDKLRVLRDCGVNRISLGVQSFDAETLTLLGRRHAPKQIFSAYEMIRAAGFDNVNFDLIFAVPGEKESRWEADLDTAIALAPEHLSAYCLILEEDAPLWTRLKNSAHFDPAEKSPEREAELYLATWEKLSRAGYEQYEVANHARAGKICRHNFNTWKMAEWLGYGPSAASQCGGKRFCNPANLVLWLEKLTDGVPAHENVEALSPEQLFEDAMIFGLRLAEGFDAEALSRRFGVPAGTHLAELAEDLRSAGYLDAAMPKNIWRPTKRGLLVADAIALKILEIRN
ncbi:MAG: radical SAM family heme chaperone HemW [Opitutales bacterium]|nr:radical SAM family heme chaperone HemW [Opitutales bacterium]